MLVSRAIEGAADRLPMTISPEIEDSLERVLNAVRTHLRMDVAFVAEFLGSSRVFRGVDVRQPVPGVVVGNYLPMLSGYCQLVAEGRLPELITDTAAYPLAQSIPETKDLPIGAHLSVPIRLDDGQIYGTICCFSHRSMPELGEPELELMRTFGRMIARQLRPDVNRDITERAKIQQVHRAMWSGDPQMVFQPLFRLSDGAMVAVEALSRFPAQNIPPDRMFADASDVGMGAVLEMLAARRAVVACRHLPYELSMGLNLSPGTIISENVANALHGFDPHRLVIEVTEHEPVVDYGPLLDALRPLREAGIRVAIDDAGAGYSSLRHVLMMKPDIVKLDISLTRNVDSDPVRQGMAAALGEFARRTGTTVVAEGVETQGELDALKALGITEVQGYFLGKPRPLADVLSDYEAARGT